MKLEALERQLTLDDTQGMFLLLGCGFFIAFIALVFELGVWIKNRGGEKLTAVAKQRLIAVSRRISVALLAPSTAYMKEHYPLYFRTVLRRRSSLFGSIISSEPVFFNRERIPPTAISEIHLSPPV